MWKNDLEEVEKPSKNEAADSNENGGQERVGLRFKLGQSSLESGNVSFNCRDRFGRVCFHCGNGCGNSGWDWVCHGSRVFGLMVERTN